MNPGTCPGDRTDCPVMPFRLPVATPGRADFFLLHGCRHVLLVPASSRGQWFLTATPLAEPPQLIPRIGPARLLRPDYAAALLPLLAEHFRLRWCPPSRGIHPGHDSSIPHSHDPYPIHGHTTPQSGRG